MYESLDGLASHIVGVEFMCVALRSIRMRVYTWLFCDAQVLEVVCIVGRNLG